MNLVIGTESIKNAVKEIRSTVRGIKNGNRYLHNEAFEKIEAAIECILDDVIPEYYVFSCTECGRQYAVNVNCLDRILKEKCKCGNDLMVFLEIRKRMPSGCVIIGRF